MSTTTKRQALIEAHLKIFVKMAETQELDKPMRDEGVKALTIAANKLAFQKKFYDSSTDSFVVFPSVRHLLLGHDIYDEAEKHYYEEQDEWPLKYKVTKKLRFYSFLR